MFELIIFILILIVDLFLGVFVFSKNPKNVVNQVFGLLSIFIVGWVASNYLVDEIGDINRALIMTKVDFSLGILVTYLVFVFCIEFTKFEISRIYKILLLFIVLGISYLSLTTNLIVSGLDFFMDGYDVVFGQLEVVYDIFIFGFAAAGITILFLKYKKSAGLERSRILFVLLGLMITVVVAAISNLVLPYALPDFPKITRLGLYGLVFFVFFTSYSILAHHLFDIRVIIKRTVVYSILLAFVLGVYSLVILVFAQIFGTGGAITVKTIAPSLIATIFIVAGFDPLRRILTKWTDSFLFKGEYKPQDVLNKLSSILSSVLDLDEALTSIIGILVTEMRLTRAGAFVLTHDPETKRMIVKRAKSVGYGEEKITLNPDKHLIAYFEQYVKLHKQVTCKDSKDEENRSVKKCNIRIDSRPIITEELEREIEVNGATDEIVKNTILELKNLKSEVSIPIIVKGRLIGVFILGAKKSGDIFSDSDLELLSSVANQTAMAIEKARFYEEDQLKSEFVSIASHELLTPTSAIEGYLSMILDEGMGKVDPQARKYLENVYASSKRLAGLVKDLLNVSRIEGGRIIIQSKNFDLKAMIQQVVAEMQPKANEKKLEFAAEGLDRDLPQVWADPERVHQALVNLISNAIKYTDKGSVKVRADFSLSVVRVSVIDTGVGIPKDEIAHLFEKFYRASNADNSGAQGTGLGLYITKQIIELMGGLIQVDSEIGKGSVFSFSLPREKEKKQN